MSRSSSNRMIRSDKQMAAPFPVKPWSNSSAKFRTLNVSYSGASSISVLCLAPVGNTSAYERKWSPPASFSSAVSRLVNSAATAVGILSAVHLFPAASSHHLTRLTQHQQMEPQNNRSPALTTSTESSNPSIDQHPASNAALSHAFAMASQTSVAAASAPAAPAPLHPAAIQSTTPTQTASEPATTQPTGSEASTASPDSNAIRTAATAYLGTPFVWGGTSPSGFDCSGFVQYVMRELGIELPRTTYDQAECGNAPAASDLEVGDLVFFQTDEAGPSHVGIYTGDGQFVHADADKGITLAYLSNPYWNSHFLFARRVLRQS